MTNSSPAGVRRNILAISGSLHSGSANSALVRLATLSNERVSVDVFESLGQLPYFNPEIDVEPAPESVAELRAALQRADGLLIATPEYAHEMPGVLKNALDWLVSSGELYGKPVAVLSAAPNAGRGQYARHALEQTLAAQGSRVVVSATVPVTPASRRSGETSAETIEAVAQALEALVVEHAGSGPGTRGSASTSVVELRLVVTATDYDEALRFYRDALGLTERAAFSSPGGRVTSSTPAARPWSSPIRHTSNLSIAWKWDGGWPAISAWRSRWTTRPV